jgi:hypothetical protein
LRSIIGASDEAPASKFARQACEPRPVDPASVPSAIRAPGFHWTWVVVGLLVLMGVAWLLHDWRGGSTALRRDAVQHATLGAAPPAQPTRIGFDRRMLAVVGVFGAVFAALCGGNAIWIFYDAGFSAGFWVDAFGLFMLLGFGLFSWSVVFAFRGFMGRPALILDAEGLNDQSSPIALGQVRWDEVQAIHWKWPSNVLATRPFVGIERRTGYVPISGVRRARQLISGAFRSRGIDPAKLSVSPEELAHLFRRYSGGRFGIAER